MKARSENQKAEGGRQKAKRGRQKAEGRRQKAAANLLRRSVRCLLPTAHCLLPSAFRLLPSAFCLLLSAFRLPPSAFRLLPSAFCLLLSAFSLPVLAQGWAQSPSPLASEDPSSGKVRMLENVGIDQRLGEQLPLYLTFRDESGVTVRLGDYFGKKPVVLTLVYYSCPMLCNQVLNGLTSALGTVSFDIGKEFEVVTVSFDPRETPELARTKKATYIDWYKRPGASDGWHFLTGDKASIDKLTEAAGFHYKFDAATNQFVHASGVMFATPDGKLARYFYGIEYAPKDLRLGLIEASEKKIGNPVDRLLLYCYHYDPASGKYGAVAMNILRLASIATVAGLVAMLWLLRRRHPTARSADRASERGTELEGVI